MPVADRIGLLPNDFRFEAAAGADARLDQTLLEGEIVSDNGAREPFV